MRSPTSPTFSSLRLKRHSRSSSLRSQTGSLSQSPPPTSSSRSSPPPSASTPGAEYASASSIAVESSVALEGRVRSIPDIGARNGTQKYLALLGLFLSAFIALLTMPYWVLRYFIVRPKGFNTLWGYLMCRGTTVTFAIDIVMPPSDTPERRARIRQVPMSINKVVSTTTVTIPAIAPQSTRPPLRPVIASIPLPGYFLAPPGLPQNGARAEPGEKIILYFHGGGYVDGHPIALPFPYKIAMDSNKRVFASTYRKVLDERSAFPAPLVDAHAAWEYLRSLGFEPNNILLLGDSAGGHLCLYLTQHLIVAAGMGARVNPAQDPCTRLPGGLALCSPWVDLSVSFPSWAIGRDYILGHRVRGAARSALRHYSPDAAMTAPLSPVFAPAGYWTPLASVPVFISYGADESMADEDKALIASMRRDGVSVQAFEEPYGLHCGPMTPWSLPSTYDAFIDGVKGVLAAMK